MHAGDPEENPPAVAVDRDAERELREAEREERGAIDEDAELAEVERATADEPGDEGDGDDRLHREEDPVACARAHSFGPSL